MKQLTAFLGLALTVLCTRAQAQLVQPLFATAVVAAAMPDSTLPVVAKTFQNPFQFRSALVSLSALTEGGRAAKAVLGFTQKNRPVEVYYFRGTSTQKALVIGGVHGSELSAIEVVKNLVQTLESGATPYYSVLVIPCLFPDNAAAAALQADEIGSTKNIGRYTHAALPDPNRQMPPLGKPFNAQKPIDFAARQIERENQLLLQVIQDYKPDRIVNVHAIRNTTRAGIYADPRTNCKGLSLGYQTDSLLAITMASYIHKGGGLVGGNKLDSTYPTALYSTDPAIAPQGSFQKRSLTGSALPNNRGTGVSLGAWASTAVCHEDAALSRQAIRVITVEFPGNKRPTDYTETEKAEHTKQMQLYTAAISQIFLGAYYTEATNKP